MICRAVNTNYSVEVDIDFYPRTGSCDRDCVERARLPANGVKIPLPSAENGEPVDVTIAGELQIQGKATALFIHRSFLLTLLFQNPRHRRGPVGRSISLDQQCSLFVHLGESSPGLAARLGMGLGISFLGVLLIGEIAFFIWRARSKKRGRSPTYANGN